MCEFIIFGTFSPPSLTSCCTLEMKMLHAERRSAVLVVMPCTWKSPQPQYPVLTIKTTCSNAAMLDLPPG